MSVESTLSTFVASDGDNLAVQEWPLEPGTRARAVLLLVHGLAHRRLDQDARAFKAGDLV